MAVNLIVGDDGSNTLLGTAGPDLIYGFNPNGPQGNVTSIAATGLRADLMARCSRPRRPAIRAGFSLSSKPAPSGYWISTPDNCWQRRS